MSKIYLDGIKFPSIDDLKKIETVSIVEGAIPDYVTSIYTPFPASAEAHFECDVDAQIFSRIAGVDLAPIENFTVELSGSYQVQIRRHKKKRINKKWAKRYGYKTVVGKTLRIVDATIHQQHDNDFEITDIKGMVIV